MVYRLIGATSQYICTKGLIKEVAQTLARSIEIDEINFPKTIRRERCAFSFYETSTNWL